MALIPNESITNFFTKNIFTLGKGENTFASKVKNAFDIKSSYDLWRIAAYIKYKPDEVLDYSQTFQTLDFTMWRGEGDCEDYARAMKKIAEKIGLKTYYWMLFTDSSYQNGHTTLLFINEKKHLTCQNYTSIYEVLDYEISEKDIYKQTEKFKSALEILNNYFYQDTLPWTISWIIKTNNNEIPEWYINATTDQTSGNIKYITQPFTREAVLKYIDNLNVQTNLTISDYVIRIGLGLIGGSLLWLLK